MLKRIIFILALSCLCFPQVAQRQSPQQPANVITTGGVGHGYAPSCTSTAGLCPGSDRTLHISGGTTQCVDILTEYAGGTLLMTDNAINYVYLDPAQDCAHAVNTTGFLQGTVWHYKVTVSGGVITAIDDVRTADAVSKVGLTGSGGTGGGTTSGTVALSGCGVAWTGNLNFTVSPCTYNIAGTQYSSPQANLTLPAADGTYDRIDVIAVDNTSNAIVIEGTAAPSPAEPSVDPATELRLIAVYVPTGSSTPSGITETDLYLENTEWTCAASANFNCASTSNPFAGTKDIEASSAVATNNVTLTKPSGTVDLSTYANLVFYIRSKAAWANAKSLSLVFMNSSTIVGASVAVKTGTCGFNSGVTGSYQQCVIPLGSFATGTNPVNKLKIAVAGGGGSIGFYLDNISIQSGTFSGSGGPQTFTITATSPIAGGGTAPVGGTLNVSCPTCGTGSGNVTGSSLTLNDFILGNTGSGIKDAGFAIIPVANGGTGLTTVAGADYALISTAAATWAAEQINSGSSCGDATHAVSYDISTHKFGCQSISGSGGSVTSVGLTVNSTSPSGIFTVTGSPVTGSGTLNFNLAGTSGGVPYFSSSTALSSSGLLTNHAITLGGGSGAAPISLSSLGTTTTVLHGNASGDPSYAAVTGSDMSANTVTSTQLAVVNTRRNCAMIFGADNGGALVDADIAPQGRQCFIPYAATVVEITVAGDAGTPNVIVRKNHAGSGTNLLSSALATASAGGIACSNTGGTTGLDVTSTCSSTLQNTSLSAGDYIETTSATAGGTAKRMSVFVTFTVN